MEYLPDVVKAVVPLLAAFCGWAAAQLRRNRKEMDALKNGVKGLLRAKVIDLGLHYISEKRSRLMAWKLLKAVMTLILLWGTVTLQLAIS